MNITCRACGYRYFRGKNLFEFGVKPFIEFKAYGSINKQFREPNTDTEVIVYACPECGTLKINI